MTHKAISLVKFPNKILTPGEFSYKKLNGLFCLYKPPDMNLEEITKKLKHYLVHGINKIPCRPVDKIVKIDEKNDDSIVDIDYSDRVEGKMKNLSSTKKINNILTLILITKALGPRYIRKDFKISYLHPLSEHDSGVMSNETN
jgi:hypothetical protein